MKFMCDAEKLLDSISMVQRAVATKAVLPILEGILIEAGDRLKLIGNDLEIAIECFIEADIYDKGSIIVNSKIFGEIIRKMPEGKILFEVQDGNSVYIECGRTNFKIKGLPSSGFPSLPDIDISNEFTIESGIFRDMIKQTAFAVSIDESRPILTGMLLECKNQYLSIVAADVVARMAFRQKECKNSINEFSTVIPARTLNEISKMIPADESKLALYIGSNHVVFKFLDCSVMSRVLDGEYINYKSIMRKDYETKIVIDRKMLLSSMERAMLISYTDKRHSVILNINDDRLVISCKTELGEITDEITIDMEGKPMNIGFNPQYFIECLRVIEDDHIEVLFTTNLGPGTVKPVKGDKYAYLIGAVRI